MRLKNVPGSREAVSNSPFVIQDPFAVKGKWHEIFGNDNPIHIEIGMGKGKFLTTLAAKNPDINYIGIEKFSSVLVRAIEKAEQLYDPDQDAVNIRFIRMDAGEIENVFDAGETDRIYLNFSDPWPKDRHAKRRLPGAAFLEHYNVILKPEGHIEFKTDNRELFDFAVSELENSIWHADYITYDLHADSEQMKENVMTEYEEKFSAKGNPICKYVIRR
ncbi:MAG: tRNA (guanosine(46)-N7)-methyltransferase TrmB [Lachnospiraceae bacterium]|nr:tRNA (guanosine(46)-N7)-methyltransferase TrmB [Lachnospiraceae bacterium]